MTGVERGPVAPGTVEPAAAVPPLASPFTLVGEAAPVCVDGVCELPAPAPVAPAAD
jgi:hypothetical protein